MTGTGLRAGGVDEATLRATVDLAWVTLLGDEPVAAPADEVRDAVRASISISLEGADGVTVVVEMEPGLAVLSAAALLGVEPDDLDDAAIEDAVGEIANVVGGNLKGAMGDEACALSLPVVTHGPAPASAGDPTAEVGSRIGGFAVRWRVHEGVVGG